jgi:outer membrane protein assembly factor BamB
MVALAGAILLAVLFVASSAGAYSDGPGTTSGSRPVTIDSGAPKGADWPTYLGNYNRTSNSTSETWLTMRDAGGVSVGWTFTSGHSLPNGSAAVYNAIASSTTVWDGIAYFGSWNGYEYALNVSTHESIWSTYLGVDTFDPRCGGTNNIGISSAPTVYNGTLYLGGNNATGGVDSAFYALNATTGSVEWDVLTGDMAEGNYSWASPLIYDGYAYVGLASNCDGPLVPAGLIQINLETNSTTPNHIVVHRFNTMPIKNGKELLGASIWSTPSLDTKTYTIYVTTGNPDGSVTTSPPNYSESIVALNASTLALESSWQIPSSQVVFDGDFGAGATILHNVKVDGKSETLVVAGNKDGYVYAWNASDVGRGPLWSTQTGITAVQIISPAAYGGGLIYVNTPAVTIHGINGAGGIFALNPSNGSIVWAKVLPGRGIGAPLFANGVIVTAAGHYVEELNATTGDMYSRVEASANFVSAPSIAEGYIWAGCENGVEYALTVPVAYVLTFSEFGLPAHTKWGVTLTPSSGPSLLLNATAPTIKFYEPNGTYSYAVAPLAGYRVSTGSYTGSITVNGSNPPAVDVHWKIVKYSVKFSEVGLPAGTNWSVTIDNQTDKLPHTSTSISFSLANGTYSFTVTAAGYVATSVPSGSVNVDGATVKVSVTFAPE